MPLPDCSAWAEAPSGNRFFPQRLAVLGATGSIGVQTLEVAATHSDSCQIVALAAGHNVELLVEQARQFQPEWVCVATEANRLRFGELYPDYPGQCLSGEAGLVTLATLDAVDTVVVGLVGIRGLRPSLAALQAGKTLATANKETLVSGGQLLQPYLPQILPFDSEHSALFQSLQGNSLEAIETLWLTASGGPFLHYSKEQLRQVTPEAALKHPNWSMGAKVTIDSSTLMNKGLEVIEAHVLFQVPAEKIRVAIHPQSVIHSAVAYQDGALIAQLGLPDMRQPIQYALSHPERWSAPYLSKRLALDELGTLDFRKPDLERFPCLRLAYEALAMGPGACTCLNAADEVLVTAFLERSIAYPELASRLEQTLQAYQQEPSWKHQAFDTIEAIEAVDCWTRQQLSSLL